MEGGDGGTEGGGGGPGEEDGGKGEEEREEGGWMGEGGRGRSVICHFCKNPCQTLHRYHWQIVKHFHALSVADREGVLPLPPPQPLPMIAHPAASPSST